MGWRNPYLRFAEIAQEPDVAMVSVDVFDTLLLRTTLPESVKFRHFGKSMYKALPFPLPGVTNPSRYMQQLRLLAARMVYHQKPRVKGGREATLDEIYDCMIHAIRQHAAVPASDCQELAEQFRRIELELELKDLSVNRLLVNSLRQARDDGKLIIAISDMYISRADLEHLLGATGVLTLFDRTYVSSEYGYGKASGVLFDTVMEDIGQPAEQICHIGDNIRSDYLVPSAKGIRAVHAPRSAVWRRVNRTRQLFGV